jgi:hypothetical protein
MKFIQVNNISLLMAMPRNCMPIITTCIPSDKSIKIKKKYLLKKKFPKREESMQSKKSTRKALIMK